MTTTPTAPLTQDEQLEALGRYGFGWSDTDVAGAAAGADGWLRLGRNSAQGG